VLLAADGAGLSGGDLLPFFSPQAVKVSISTNDKNMINVFFIKLPPFLYFS